MELSELAAYAEEKFHIREQHKWADFPGFSVLADPETGKWLALLMRQWDSDTGTELQRCDIKCGRQILAALPEPFLAPPFRMKGQKWVGVLFDRSTKPEVVFRLFDRAVYSEKQRGFTVVLENPPSRQIRLPKDTPLSPAGPSLALPDPEIPERIRSMRRLYEYRGNSFAQKCRNFCRQARFMEDYEDDAPWNGAFRHYFPTYQDLNTRQLRGYFTWRTRLRKGEFSPAPASFACLYLYELLNGIGAAPGEEVLQKMQEFRAGFLDSGIGDADTARNLRRWMLDYAVITGISPDQARQYAAPALLERDAFLHILKDPENHRDEEIFEALCAFDGGKPGRSPVIRKDPQKGRRLFAALWRAASESPPRKDQTFFTACFGEQKKFPWHPLAGAVYWEENLHADTDYPLNDCRIYRCRGGVWTEERYDPLYFDRKLLHGLLHEGDRQFRRKLKTGHYLRENPEEAWAAPYAMAALEAEARAEAEAARPTVTLDLSSLEQIRLDARSTRDSLLTEADTEDFPAEAKQPEDRTALPSPASSLPGNLDGPHLQILLLLLKGEPPQAYIRSQHLMPSMAADTINEAFFEEIGDSILECDGQTITVVEDYREEILKMLGGITDES